MNLPRSLACWSVDEVAECLPVTSATYTELWEALESAHKAGTAKPCGGDGSDGTMEEPEASSGEYGSDLASAWPSLSDAAKLDICNAAKLAAGGIC
jgi:hypothetical protein